jgi:predicted alpha/beta hydrolase
MDPTVEYLERGGDRIALHSYPEPGGRGPVALILPAMGVPARYYGPFARALHGHGFAVVAADLRGTGASTPRAGRTSRYGYGELAGDVAAIRATLAARCGDRPLILIGHSLGGQAALLDLALHVGERHPYGPGAGAVLGEERSDGGQAAPQGPSGPRGRSERQHCRLALVAAGLPYWRRYPGRRRFGVLGLTQAIAATATMLRFWPGWGFGGRQARNVMTDWAYTARSGRYPRLGGVDTEAALATLRTPVLAISVEPDRFTPAAVVDFLTAKLSAAPVERAHFTAATLGAPIDHFRWVRAAEPIAARIAAFAGAASGSR